MPVRRAARAGDRRRARRARVRHRRAQGHAGPRPHRLRDRPRARPARADGDRPRRAHERGGRRARRARPGGGRSSACSRGARSAACSSAASRTGTRSRVCERCESRIEPLISLQWWCRMDELKQPAIEALRDAPRPLPPGVAAPLRDRLARARARLEHLAPALVGAPAPRLVLPRRPRHRRRDRAGRLRGVRLDGARARPGRARHVVLVGALAVRDARLAGRHARAAALLPRRPQHRPRARSSASGRTG